MSRPNEENRCKVSLDCDRREGEKCGMQIRFVGDKENYCGDNWDERFCQCNSNAAKIAALLDALKELGMDDSIVAYIRQLRDDKKIIIVWDDTLKSYSISLPKPPKQLEG